MDFLVEPFLHFDFLHNSFILAIATTGVPNAISKLVSEKLAVNDAKGFTTLVKAAKKALDK